MAAVAGGRSDPQDDAAGVLYGGGELTQEPRLAGSGCPDDECRSARGVVPGGVEGGAFFGSATKATGSHIRAPPDHLVLDESSAESTAVTPRTAAALTLGDVTTLTLEAWKQRTATLSRPRSKAMYGSELLPPKPSSHPEC